MNTFKIIIIIFVTGLSAAPGRSKIPISINYLFQKASEPAPAFESEPTLVVKQETALVVNQGPALVVTPEPTPAVTLVSTPTDKEILNSKWNKFFNSLIDYLETFIGVVLGQLLRFIIMCLKKFCLKQNLEWVDMI